MSTEVIQNYGNIKSFDKFPNSRQPSGSLCSLIENNNAQHLTCICCITETCTLVTFDCFNMKQQYRKKNHFIANVSDNLQKKTFFSKPI